MLSSCFLLMELNKEDLQSLVEKAWGLHGRLNGEIKNSISFCRFCPEHGRNFHIAETPFDEREILISIRDSLKEVEDKLMFLQVNKCPFTLSSASSSPFSFLILSSFTYIQHDHLLASYNLMNNFCKLYIFRQV